MSPMMLPSARAILAKSVLTCAFGLGVRDWRAGPRVKPIPFPPRNHYATFEFAKSLPSLKEVIVKSIKTVAEEMLNPPIGDLGINGIRKFGQEFLKLTSYAEFTFDSKTTGVFRDLCIWLEEAGTGVSCFRNLYGDILEESMRYVENENFAKGCREYERIADAWKEFSRLLLEIDEGKTDKLREV